MELTNPAGRRRVRGSIPGLKQDAVMLKCLKMLTCSFYFVGSADRTGDKPAEPLVRRLTELQFRSRSGLVTTSEILLCGSVLGRLSPGLRL